MSVKVSKNLDESLEGIEKLFLYRLSRIRQLMRLANNNEKSDAGKQIRIIKMFSFFSNKLSSALYDAELDKEFAEASVADLEDILFGRNKASQENKLDMSSLKNI